MAPCDSLGNPQIAVSLLLALKPTVVILAVACPPLPHPRPWHLTLSYESASLNVADICLMEDHSVDSAESVESVS